MKPYMDFKVPTRTYRDKHTGEEKRFWQKCGTLFMRDDRTLAFKMDVVPLNWDGWGNFFPIENRQAPAAPQPQAPQQQGFGTSQPMPDFPAEDIPF